VCFALTEQPIRGERYLCWNRPDCFTEEQRHGHCPNVHLILWEPAKIVICYFTTQIISLRHDLFRILTNRKPTTVHIHDGGIEGIAESVHQKLSEDFQQYFDYALFNENNVKSA
jgi:hypothetical protein